MDMSSRTDFGCSFAKVDFKRWKIRRPLYLICQSLPVQSREHLMSEPKRKRYHTYPRITSRHMQSQTGQPIEMKRTHCAGSSGHKVLVNPDVDSIGATACLLVVTLASSPACLGRPGVLVAVTTAAVLAILRSEVSVWRSGCGCRFPGTEPAKK